ncbi:MAG: hypothetical protein ABIJ60_02140 [Patescibacteria group bacterium]
MKINKNIKNNGRCYVLGDVEYLKSMGRDFAKSALLLFKTKEKTGEWSDFVYSFNLLVSQALETLPKSIIATRICLNKNNRSIKEIHCIISKELKCLEHKLDNIFNEVPELKKELNIINIERSDNKFPQDEFIFTINESGKIKKFSIKNLEGARYGSFARKRNLGANYDSGVKKFLQNLMDVVLKIQEELIQDFDKKSKIKC